MTARLKHLALIATLALLLASCAALALSRGPRLDGLYCCTLDEVGKDAQGNPVQREAWLRFYDDATVVAVTTRGGTAEQVARWFRRDYDEYIAQGKYTVEGQSIKFSTTTPRGVVDYEGQIGHDKMTLAIHSRINDHQTSGNVYTFVPLEQKTKEAP